MHDLGGDPEVFRKRFRIPPGIENQKDTFISVDAYRAFWKPARKTSPARTSGSACRAGRDWTSGLIAAIARNAQTVLGGMEMIGRYPYVHSPALTLTLAPRTSQSDLRFTYEVTEPGLTSLVQSYEISMAVVARIRACWAVRRRGSARSRSCTTNRARTRHTAKFWGAQCVSDRPGAASRYPGGWPIDGSRAPTPETRRIATKYLESNYLPPTASLSERVAELTRRLLPTGHCSVDAIADQLAMHPRSLQRRLTTEGVGCQELIDAERRTLAAKSLAEPGLHFSQIAGLLGYAEQSTFNRSCRRWFAKTPRQYRAGLPGTA